MDSRSAGLTLPQGSSPTVEHQLPGTGKGRRDSRGRRTGSGRDDLAEIRPFRVEIGVVAIDVLR